MARCSNQPRVGPRSLQHYGEHRLGRSRFLTPTGALKNARPLNGDRNDTCKVYGWANSNTVHLRKLGVCWHQIMDIM